MPQRKLKPTDPWAALDAIVKYEAEPTGPEWFTVEQFAERYKISYASAGSKCQRMHRDGKLNLWKGLSTTSRRTINKYSLK
jgi:hypothetical protein